MKCLLNYFSPFLLPPISIHISSLFQREPARKASTQIVFVSFWFLSLIYGDPILHYSLNIFLEHCFSGNYFFDSFALLSLNPELFEVLRFKFSGINQTLSLSGCTQRPIYLNLLFPVLILNLIQVLFLSFHELLHKQVILLLVRIWYDFLGPTIYFIFVNRFKIILVFYFQIWIIQLYW